MNVDKKKLSISDKELIEYLSVTQKILVAAKTELDIEHLKNIINALKNNEYEVIHEENNIRLSLKKDVQSVLKYLEKIQSKQEVDKEEIELFEEYCNKNILMKCAVEQSYDELFSILSNNKDIYRNELVIVYQYLIGKKSKALKLDNMIDEIKQYIYKIKNFNDMDAKFERKK